VARPAVVIDPGRKYGTPRLDGTRVACREAADACWAGGTASEVADQLGLDRQQVIVACWFMVRFAQTDQQRQKWRRRWRAWADEHEHLIRRDQWHAVPDPPSGGA